ncbi:hypothetical protein L3Q82_007585 [Scortum barcoo]|uniref:Uncharacterized protein n=1 Tax=Scortum barcoo TaxID=214431 RepID=A0ACB8WNF5_9TELE|nr:hypothetical protein L3Q82_007585 [Scortum barcoo]
MRCSAVSVCQRNSIATKGVNFEAQVFTEICRWLGIKKTRTTTPLHPQSDGLVECFNRTLATQLAILTSSLAVGSIPETGICIYPWSCGHTGWLFRSPPGAPLQPSCLDMSSTPLWT